MRKFKTRAMMIALGILIGISMPSAALEIDSTKSPVNDNSLWSVDVNEAYRLLVPNSKFNSFEETFRSYYSELFGPNRSFSEMNKDCLVLASNRNYADALTGGPLAVALNSNILLYDNKYTRFAYDHKDADPIFDIVRTSNVKKLYILGGTDSFPEEDVKALNKDLKAEVIRIGGKDKYETSYLISKVVRDIWKDSKKSVFVSGKKLEDIVPSTSLALKMKAPIIISNGKDLPSGNGSVYSADDYQNNFIVGGKDSIDIPQLKAERLSGKDRYETAIDIAERYFKDSPGAHLISATPAPHDLEYANRFDNSYNAPVLYANTKSKKGVVNESTKKYLEKYVSYVSHSIPYSELRKTGLANEIKKVNLSNNMEKTVNYYDKYRYSVAVAKAGDQSSIEKAIRLTIKDILYDSLIDKDRAYNHPKHNGDPFNIVSIDRLTPEGNNFYNVAATVEIYVKDPSNSSKFTTKTIKIDKLHIQVLNDLYYKVRMYAEDLPEYNFLDKGKTSITLSPESSTSNRIRIYTPRSDYRIDLDGSGKFYQIDMGIVGATSKNTKLIRGNVIKSDEPEDPNLDNVYFLYIGSDEKADKIVIKPYISKKLQDYAKKNNMDVIYDANTITVNIDHINW